MSNVNWEAVSKEQMKIIHDKNEQLDVAINAMQTAVEKLDEYEKSDICFNAVIDYILNKGYMESPLEFLRCWNEGDFEALREEWPDAPEEIYLADPLYKGKK